MDLLLVEEDTRAFQSKACVGDPKRVCRGGTFERDPSSREALSQHHKKGGVSMDPSTDLELARGGEPGKGDIKWVFKRACIKNADSSG